MANRLYPFCQGHLCLYVDNLKLPCPGGNQESAFCMQELQDIKPKVANKLKKQESCFATKEPC